MSIVPLIVQSLVAVAFLWRAGAKLLGAEAARAQFASLRMGRTGRWFIGVLELVGGLGLLVAAVAQPFLVFFLAGFLALVSFATVAVHVVRGNLTGVGVVGLMLGGALAAGALQPLGLKVMLLPRAATLPHDPVVSAHTVKSYSEGVWFESVAIGADGTVYLSGNKGENYATGDRSQVHAQVIARAPDGTERVFFDLPQGSTSGVIAFDSMGQMYMTGQGGKLGVWRLHGPGKGELFAPLPKGAWPNGMTVGPDGKLYVADAALGIIWRVDPTSGNAEKAIDSPVLRARPLISLAPGGNGVHFHGRDMYVTVSDAGRVMKFTLGTDGTFGKPVVFAEGIPGDDFAVDSEGTMYITTHPFNTIVRVRQDGRRDIVANESQGITGATDAKFGVLPGDVDTLYVATDGGAFSGDPKARGALVALKVKR